MEVSTKKRKREDEPPRITVSAPHKTFERLFKESSLLNLRDSIAKKLGFDEKTSFELVQSRAGRTIDLEDDDDFDAFRSYAYSNGSAEVRVRVSGQARTVAFTSQPEIIPSPSTVPSSPRKKKKKKRSQTPEDTSSDTLSTTTTSENTNSPSTSASRKPKSRAKKSVREKAKTVDSSPSNAGPSKTIVAPDATGSDELISDKQHLASIPPSGSSTEALTPKPKENKVSEEGKATTTPPSEVKAKSKRKKGEVSEKSLDATATEQATSPQPSEPLVKKKKKQAVEAEQVGSSSAAVATTPTEQPNGIHSLETNAPPLKGAKRKIKKAEKATSTPLAKERIDESVGNTAEKETSVENSRKEQRTVDCEPSPSSMSDPLDSPNTAAPNLASTSQQPPNDLTDIQKPAKKRKKLTETVQQDLSISDTRNVSRNTASETKRKRKVSIITIPQEVQEHEEEALPSEPPRKKSKRSSLTAQVAPDDALDDIINNILKNRSLSATLRSTPQIPVPVSQTPVVDQNPSGDIQAKEKEAGVGSRAKAGKNRKREIINTDESVASSSTAKEVATKITPPLAAKPVERGKRVSATKDVADQPNPRNMDVQNLAEQESDSISSHRQPTSGDSLPKLSSKKEAKRKPALTITPVESNNRPLSLGMLPFAPSGSSLSEVLVEGRDEGSSAESEGESHDSDSSDSSRVSTPSTKAVETQQSHANSIPAVTIIESLLLESLLKPKTPRSWRDILSSPENGSEDEKASSVPDEEEEGEEYNRRERKKRRSSAFVRRSSSTPSVDEEEDDNDENGAEISPPEGEIDKALEKDADEEIIVEPLRDHIADQESLTHSNADSGYGSMSLKQPDGIEAGPLFCGSQRSTTGSELNLSFKAINDRGESVISEGRKSQEAASILSDGAQVFTMTKEEMNSRSTRSGTSSPDPIGLMIDEDPIENNDSGIESSRSRRSSSGRNAGQASVNVGDGTAASLANFVGQKEQDSEDLAFIYPDDQEDVSGEKYAEHNMKNSGENEPQKYMNGLLNVAGRSFTPPPIATLAPGTPGTLRRMKDRHGKLPYPVNTSKGTVIIPASSQIDSSNTPDSAVGDTTEGEDHIDQLLSSSVPRGHQPIKAVAINTVKRQRKTQERRSDGDGEDLPIGSRLRKRRQTMQVETTTTAMPPPAKPRRTARPRAGIDSEAAKEPNSANVEAFSDVLELATAKSIPKAIPNVADASKSSTRAEGASSSLSEVENALEVTSDRASVPVCNKVPPVDTNDDGKRRAESPESQVSESDEGETAVETKRDFGPRPSFSTFQSLQKIVSQPNLFSPATSQPSFLLKPVRSFENINLPASQIVQHDDIDDDDSSDSDSDSDGESVIPKEKRAGNKSTKSRGALDAIRSYVGL